MSGASSWMELAAPAADDPITSAPKNSQCNFHLRHSDPSDREETPDLSAFACAISAPRLRNRCARAPVLGGAALVTVRGDGLLHVQSTRLWGARVSLGVRYDHPRCKASTALSLTLLLCACLFRSDSVGDYVHRRGLDLSDDLTVLLVRAHRSLDRTIHRPADGNLSGPACARTVAAVLVLVLSFGRGCWHARVTDCCRKPYCKWKVAPPPGTLPAPANHLYTPPVRGPSGHACLRIPVSLV